MTGKTEKDPERRRAKNTRERLKRRKERMIQNLHEYALLSNAKAYLLIQDCDGQLAEYRNTPDKKFPPSYSQIRRLFPSAKLLTPESFGSTPPVTRQSTRAGQQNTDEHWPGLDLTSLAPEFVLPFDGSLAEQMPDCAPMQFPVNMEYADRQLDPHVSQPFDCS